MLVDKEFPGDKIISKIPSFVTIRAKELLASMLPNDDMAIEEPTVDDEKTSYYEIIMSPGKRPEPNARIPRELLKFINFLSKTF